VVRDSDLASDEDAATDLNRASEPSLGGDVGALPDVAVVADVDVRVEPSAASEPRRGEDARVDRAERTHAHVRLDDYAGEVRHALHLPCRTRDPAETRTAHDGRCPDRDSIAQNDPFAKGHVRTEDHALSKLRSARSEGRERFKDRGHCPARVLVRPAAKARHARIGGETRVNEQERSACHGLDCPAYESEPEQRGEVTPTRGLDGRETTDLARRPASQESAVRLLELSERRATERDSALRIRRSRQGLGAVTAGAVWGGAAAPGEIPGAAAVPAMAPPLL
jgi:hypothetical protein